MIRLILSAVSLAMSVSLPVLARDPVGETASYQLDRASARTTSLINAGSMAGRVTQFLPDYVHGPSYNVDLDYDVNVQFYGRQAGTVSIAFPKGFFEPSFWEGFRNSKEFANPDFKMTHEGFADAKTLDGGNYPHCDKVYIYDIVIPGFEGLESILYMAAGYDPNNFLNPPIENLRMRAYIYQGVPVIGAVKVDLTGTIKGVGAKAGFDYKR